jgi:hypothetical protein
MALLCDGKGSVAYVHPQNVYTPHIVTTASSTAEIQIKKRRSSLIIEMVAMLNQHTNHHHLVQPHMISSRGDGRGHSTGMHN